MVARRFELEIHKIQDMMGPILSLIVVGRLIKYYIVKISNLHFASTSDLKYVYY